MADDIRVGPDLEIPAAEIRWRFSRSSGPGGQSVNTTDSRVELIWQVETSPTVQALPSATRRRLLHRLERRLTDGALVIAASEHRSQLRNRDAATDRLVEMLRDALSPPPPARRPTRPSRGSVQRRLEAKSRRSEIKRDRQKPTD